MNKKLLLSLATIGAFVVYAFAQENGTIPSLAQASTTLPSSQTTSSTDTPTTSTTGSSDSYTQYLAQVNAQAAANAGDEDSSLGDDPEEGGSAAPTQAKVTTTQPSTSKPTPAPTPAPKTTTTTTSSGQYKNGTYTGSSVNVYYGTVQVAAVISDGKLTNVNILQYPNDRHESLQRSNYALPQLTKEAIAAQSARIDSISGASATSQGFVESLTSALSQAKA